MSFSPSLFLAGLLLTSLSPAAAQTWSACNPTNVTTCSDNPALGMGYNFDFSQTNITDTWNATAGTVTHSTQGGAFTINKRYDSPTLQSNFYFFGGVVEVHMKAATGQGVISSIVLESDDLDEVDWEMMGGNNTHVETNYFGKGNTTSYDRAIYYPVDKPLETFHNYTVHWTKDKIEWYIDTALVRTLPYAAANGGNNFPQTPMNVRIGIWAGGDPENSNGTIEWAGGLTDFTKGPYTMYVQNVSVTDFSTGASAYHWSDKSGNWESIKTIAGNSTAKQTLLATPAPSVADKWNALPSGARIGIYAGAGAVGAALLGMISFCCIRQRRAGRREQAAYAARLETERMEQEAYQLENKSPDALASAPTPSEYSQGSNKPEYTKAGAAGFGSGGYSAPRADAASPMPSPPPAYGMGGLRSPSAGGGFTSPSLPAFNQNVGGYNNSQGYNGNNRSYSNQGQNGYFHQGYSNNGYSNNGYSNNGYGRPGAF